MFFVILQHYQQVIWNIMKFSLPLLVTMLLLQITTAQAQESAIKLGVRLGVGISMSPKMGDH